MEADEIGFASIPQEWVFKYCAIRFRQAIVLGMELDLALSPPDHDLRLDVTPTPGPESKFKVLVKGRRPEAVDKTAVSPI